MKEKILLIKKHLKQGTFKKMWTQTVWIYLYASRNRGVRCLPDFQPDFQRSGGYHHRPPDRAAS